MRVLQVVKQAVIHYYEEMLPLVGASIITWLLCLPVVTAPPVLAGLYHMTFPIVIEKRYEFSLLWEGFREYFWASWRLAGAVVVITIVLVSNAWFYGVYMAQGAEWLRWVGIAWAAVLVWWLAAQLYMFPLLVRLEVCRVRDVLKNAVLLVFVDPVLTFSLMVLLVLFILVSLALPILLIALPGLGALIGHHALSSVMEQVRRKTKT